VIANLFAVNQRAVPDRDMSADDVGVIVIAVDDCVVLNIGAFADGDPAAT